MQQVVASLGQLARAHRTNPHHAAAAIGREHRTGELHIGFVAAAQREQRAFLRTGGAIDNRRIDEADAARRAQLLQRDHGLGMVGCGHSDE
jgi:hypothetical protein